MQCIGLRGPFLWNLWLMNAFFTFSWLGVVSTGNGGMLCNDIEEVWLLPRLSSVGTNNSNRTNILAILEAPRIYPFPLHKVLITERRLGFTISWAANPVNTWSLKASIHSEWEYISSIAFLSDDFSCWLFCKWNCRLAS